MFNLLTALSAQIQQKKENKIERQTNPKKYLIQIRTFTYCDSLCSHREQSLDCDLPLSRQN